MARRRVRSEEERRIRADESCEKNCREDVSILERRRSFRKPSRKCENRSEWRETGTR